MGNPLNNRNMMQKLNPNANAAFKAEQAAQVARRTARAAALKHNRSKAGQAEKRQRTARFNALNSGLLQSFADADAVLEAERKAGLIDESEEEEEDDDE